MSKGSGTSGHGAGGGAALAALGEASFSTGDIPAAEDAKFAAQSAALRDHLSEAERQAIARYTDERYAEIRAAAAGEKGVTAQDIADAATIHRALKKAQKIEQVVYRGMSVSERTLKQMMRMKEIRIAAPTSTSRDVAMGKAFVQSSYDRHEKQFGVIFKIRQKSGASVESMSSMGAGEREILIPKGVRLKVTRIQKTSVNRGISGTVIPTLVIHATEI